MLAPVDRLHYVGMHRAERVFVVNGANNCRLLNIYVYRSVLLEVMSYNRSVLDGVNFGSGKERSNLKVYCVRGKKRWRFC